MNRRTALRWQLTIMRALSHPSFCHKTQTEAWLLSRHWVPVQQLTLYTVIFDSKEEP